MTYRQLQRLAKESGIKANLPKAQLVLQLCQVKNTPKTTKDTLKTPEKPETTKDTTKHTPMTLEKTKTTKDTPKTAEKPETTKTTPMTLEKTKTTKDTPKTAEKPKRSSSLGILPERFVEFVAPAENDVNKTKTPPPPPISPPTARTPRRSTPKDMKKTGIKSSGTPKPASGIRNSVKSALKARLSGIPGSVTKAKTSSIRFRSSLNSPLKATPRNDSSKSANFGSRTAERSRLKQALKNSGSQVKETQIPQFVSKRAPNFAKMHAEQFNKMDSLDVHLSKKKERMESIRKKVVSTKKTEAKPVRRSPRIQENIEAKTNQRFAPSNLVVNEKNFQFGKMSPTKPYVFKATPQNKVLSNITNRSTNVSNAGSAKTNFDLKKSLAKPLSYKPHKGKVLSLDEENKKRETGKKDKQREEIKENSRKMIKGVRLNKRAELLLQRRNNLA